jgi:hypothetical protein
MLTLKVVPMVEPVKTCSERPCELQAMDAVVAIRVKRKVRLNEVTPVVIYIGLKL